MKSSDPEAVSRIDALLDEVCQCAESPRNKEKHNAPEPRFYVYLENIGWAQLFDYDMNDYYSNAQVQFEMQLRQKLFQWEHFDDDTALGPDIGCTVGMYFEYPFFDLHVWHEPCGVPQIREDHPMTKTPDVKLLKPHNFYSTGEMPHLLQLYEDLKALAAGRVNVSFPTWGRGPLDLAIQLRGYVNFVHDTRERPQFVHDLMRYIVEERIRWWEEYRKFLGTDSKASGIADDWAYTPFISPGIFGDFCLPRYLELEEYHGSLWGVHSCGNKVPFLPYLLELKSVGSFEVNAWTPLAEAARRTPADKFLAIALLNADVLLLSEEELEAELRNIVATCEGRKYSITGSSIQKVHDDYEEDIARTKAFIRVAKRVLRDER